MAARKKAPKKRRKSKPLTPKKRGRPPVFTGEALAEAKAQIIEARRTTVGSLRRLVQENPGFPADSLIWQWWQDDPDFKRMYDDAHEHQRQNLVDDSTANLMGLDVEIDPEDPRIEFNFAQTRLYMDHAKASAGQANRLAAQMAPKKQKIEVEVDEGFREILERRLGK
jgi:hypothetical protein